MSHRAIYWTVAGVLGALLVVMLFSYDYGKGSSTPAEAKAQELIDAFTEADISTRFTTEQIARVLGEDGGAVCASAGSGQQLGYLKTQLSVGGEFYQRPVIVDGRMLKGYLLIVETYCPDKLDDVRELADNLRYDDVIRT